MKKLSISLFGNRAARQSFVILIVSTFLIIGAAVSVASMYLLYGRHPITVKRLADEAVKGVVLARSLPTAQLPKVLHMLSQPGLHLRMTPQPNKHAQLIEFVKPAQLRKYIYAHPHDFRISLQLTNGQWLNIFGHRPRSDWVSLGALFSAAALLLALIVICVWAVKRLAWPWDAFTKAARRFGVDPDAPPLAVTGPYEVQVVIKAFNEMQLRIRRLINDRTQMLAAISHDLRTPITRLQLRAEYLEGTDQYAKTVADLHEMEKMIASILAFARDHASKEPMERFDLAVLLETLVADLQDVGQPVNFIFPAGSRLTYFGRMTAIKRALVNLIENAVKYGNKADVTLKQDEQSNVQVVIEDEGPGIPDELMESVFSPFYRIDVSRSLQKSGTGLGMATARDIVRAHGGDVKLYNRCERGLRVVVNLPKRTV